MNTQTKAAANIIRNACRSEGEVSERRIFDLCEQSGIDAETTDETIDEMLDLGVVASTILDATAVGHGYVPMLRLAS
jgi:hypothetical protein